MFTSRHDDLVRLGQRRQHDPHLHPVREARIVLGKVCPGLENFFGQQRAGQLVPDLQL